MQEVVFKKKVSKGSRFNQIYIPKDMEDKIRPDDLVEVRLVKKAVKIHYSKGLRKLSDFKEMLVKEVFSLSETYAQKVFIVGSFLTEKIDYNDIDVVVISDKEGVDELVYKKLTDKLNMKFHVMSISKDKFDHLIKACPLTRAMFSRFVSDHEAKMESEKELDKKHLRFLLMMPEDLLEIRLSSKIFFDNLRRLITIERFLQDKSLEMEEVKQDLDKLLGEKLYKRMKNNQDIEDNTVEELRKILKDKLKKIKGML